MAAVPVKSPAYDTHLPVVFRPASAPSLPASSGAFWGSATSILKKDTEFVNVHTAFLNARTAQHGAANALMQARLDCELTATRIANVDTIKAHEFLRGQHDREQQLLGWQHTDELSALKRETELVDAKLALLQAQAALRGVQRAAPSPSPTTDSLSVQDLDQLIASMPEVSEETRSALLCMARGLLSEKVVEPAA